LILVVSYPLRRSQVSLKDGRILDVVVAGPGDGIPLVFHHGTPGAAITFEPFVNAAVSRGLRYFSYSRPGYGHSTRQEGRVVANCAADAQDVVAQFGGDRFFTIGWSGGGPHALACAALLPEHVIAASSIAGIAPWGSKNLDWLAGMGKENIEELGAALSGREKLQLFLERVGPEFASVTGDQIIRAFGDLVDDVDKMTLSGQLGDFLAGNIREALSQGFSGWLDDDMAFIRDWGFDLTKIPVPVSIWQGAKDRMVPYAHGQWLAEHVPGVTKHLMPDHGHLSLTVGSFGLILDDLIAHQKH
jgi:pimeloyl-ACP methyl ester carboxylesterase